MSNSDTTKKPIILHSMKYWAGYDNSNLNILGFPKMVKIFKNKRDAMREFDCVYQITIKG